MALDSRLALGAQGVDGLAMFDNSQKVAGVLDQNKTQNEFRRLYEMSKGDLGQMATNAQDSKLFAMVMPQIQAQQAAVAKAALDGQKTQAEIGKFNAGATKDYADAGKTMQAVTVDKHRQQASALAAAMQGDARAADFSLQLAEQGGQIDAATAAQARKFIVENANNPEAISSMVRSLATMAAEKPEQYITPDANNANTNATSLTNNSLDNDTSRLNNTANNQTSMRGQDITANTQSQKLAVDQQQFSVKQALEAQKAAFAQNKVVKYETDINGNKIALFADGSGRVVLGEDGKPVQMPKPVNKAALKPVLPASIAIQLAELQGLNDTGASGIASLKKAIALSEQGIYDGVGAETRAKAWNNVKGGSEESQRTTEYMNVVTAQALSSLKATFGGNPTEGERAILMDIQASAKYPAPVRKKILESAIATMEGRIASNKKQAQMLRDNSLPQGQSQQQAPQQARPTPEQVGTIGMADVLATAKSSGKPPEQVVAELRQQGYEVK